MSTDAKAAEQTVNWTLLTNLAGKPHRHLNISDCELTCAAGHQHEPGTSEVLQEARTVQHLCDLAGIPEGKGYAAHIDARVYLLMMQLFSARERLERLADWHSRAKGPSGTFDDYCTECGERWPCDTRRMAEGTYVDALDTAGAAPAAGGEAAR